MIIGMYYLTQDLDGLTGEGRAFSSKAEAVMAYDLHQLDLRAKCKIRLSGVVPPVGLEDKQRADGSLLLDTTLGQVIFNEALPDNYPYVTSHVGKKQLSAIINDLAIRFPRPVVVATLDNLKDMGFRWGTQSGVTVSIGDVQTPRTSPRSWPATRRRLPRSTSSTTAVLSPRRSVVVSWCRSGMTPRQS